MKQTMHFGFFAKWWLIALAVNGMGAACSPAAPESPIESRGERIELPDASAQGQVSVEETMARRRSRRNYRDQPLSDRQLAQLLWAGQGVTDSRRGFRTAPSAGATYPLQLYVATAQGVFLYHPGEHELSQLGDRDRRPEIAAASLGQRWMAEAGAIVIMVARPERTTRRYGERGRRYIDMEAGHVAQNLHLQAVALGLGSVPVGAFDPSAISLLLGGEQAGAPVYIVCIGHLAE